MTNQQIFNLVLTLLNNTDPLTLGVGSVTISSDGSIANGGFVVSGLGTILIGSNKNVLGGDGSAAFATGQVIISAAGSVQFLGAVIVNNADLEIANPNQGVIQHSRPGNIRYRIVIDDAGNLGTEAA